MKQIIERIKKKSTLGLTITNIFLITLLLIQKDPFGIFIRTYDTSPKFINSSESDIKRIVYGRLNEPKSHKEIIMEGSEWKFKNNNNYIFSADNEKVKLLLKALIEARKFTIAATGKDKFKEYGLEGEDALFIELFSDNGISGKYTIGNSAGGGSFTHILFNDSEDIYIVEDSIKPLFGRGADDFFIQKRITEVSVSSADIKSIEWSSKSTKPFKFNFQNNVWIDDTGKPVDRALIDPLLNKVSSLFADSVIEDTNIPKLDVKKSGALSFSYGVGASDTEKKITLEIMGTDPQEFFYTKLENRPGIYKFPPYQLKEIYEIDKK